MSVQAFRKLHANQSPLMLGNVWDAHSAQLAVNAGFEALGTSSHAIANLLGYEDGQNMSFEEHFFIIERIVKSVNVPVSVDFEAGYSDDPETVATYVKKLVDVGVVGINIEDGIVKNGKRHLESADLLAAKIQAIKATTELYINARADTYTTKHEDALGETIRRGRRYQEVGADGLFVPLIENSSDIQALTREVSLPLNVFLTPNLLPYDELGSIGVKRISHGAKLYGWLMGKAEKELENIKTEITLPK